ncbi:SPOR domain-containing protein [Amphibacillus sp. Q70]|uniref:SPOR domain-containing protein n=1 Tax=Amphibacillus sp. Q70 TaxID=3453416 RepID=UPI003F85988C
MESKYQVTYKLSDDKGPSVQSDTFQESAASLTELEPYKYGENSSKHDRDKKRSWIRIVLTALSAVLIGTSFGLLLLFIFSHDEDVPVTEQPNKNTTAEDSSSDAAATEDNQKIELNALSGYVIQAGVFESLEQAELTRETLVTQGHPSIVWETETDYRVFLAAYQSEGEAKQAGEQLAESGLEVYAREWQSNEGAANLAGEEEWLNEFQDLWQQSFSGYTDEVEQAWNNWLNIDQTDLSDHTQQFYQDVESTLRQLNDEQLPFYLLDLWNHYHHLTN